MEQIFPDFLQIVSFIFVGILSSIAQIIICAVCIYFYRKMGTSAESVLLLMGSLLITLVSITSGLSVVFSMYLGKEKFATLTLLFRIISFVGAILFAIGFLITIRKIVRNKISTQN